MHRYARFWAVLAAVFLLDQATKIWIHDFSGLSPHVYPPHGGIEVIPGFFAIVFATNRGAAWGMLTGFGIWLAALAIIILAAVYVFRRWLQLGRPAVQLAFGLICGGILGNLVDRLAHGYVIDFLDFHLGFYRWPTFNIADCGIVIGAGLYLFLTWREEPSDTSPRPPSRSE